MTEKNPSCDEIAEVGITEEGHLYVTPRTARFQWIYREAMEISWDNTKLRLYTPTPRQWSYLDWFRHILAAAKQQGTDLQLTSKMVWTRIPDNLRKEIEKQ